MEPSSFRQPGQKVCVVRFGAGRVQGEVAGGGNFEGVIRELGISHLSAFLRSCAQEGGISKKLSTRLADSLDKRTELTLSIHFRGRELGPLKVRVRNCEKSWIRGYSLFVVGDFLTLGEEQRKTIEALIEEEKKRALPQVKPHAVPPPTPASPASGGEAVRVTFPAKRCHAVLFRNLCEWLAQQAGFAERDVFMIKLAADEVFMNAVTHGSELYGISRVQGDILLDPEGITVVVRDEGGLPFDYQRYKSGRRELEPGSVKSGLDIVDKIMDSWAVRTEEGKFTEVVFRKKRAGDFDKKSDAQPISASI